MNIRWFSQVFTANGSWTAPDNLLIGSVGAFATGPGGTGAGSIPLHDGGAAGGGGALGGEPALGGVGPGTVLTITVPAGGSGSPTTITGGSVTVQGNAGASATSGSTGAGAAGGTAGTNTIAFAGGQGGAGVTAGSGSRSGGGGGGSAGSTGAGGAGSAGSASTSTGGAAGTGDPAGAVGGTCAVAQPGQPGNVPGAGGAGAGGSGQAAGTGAVGQALIVWAVITSPGYSRGTPSAVRGRSSSSAGAPVQQFVPAAPSPFTPPRRAPRGLAPVRGRVLELGQYSPGAPIRPTPSPFTPPRRAPRGLAPVRGRVLELGLYSPGAPVVPVPAPFTPPRRAPRGLAPVRGRTIGPGLRSVGSPVPPPPKKLLISIAAQAGTDDYGTPFPQGLTVYAASSSQNFANLNEAVLTFQTQNGQQAAGLSQAGEGGIALSSGGFPVGDIASETLMLSALSSGFGVPTWASNASLLQLGISGGTLIPASPPSVSGADGIAIVAFLRSVGICT